VSLYALPSKETPNTQRSMMSHEKKKIPLFKTKKLPLNRKKANPPSPLPKKKKLNDQRPTTRITTIKNVYNNNKKNPKWGTPRTINFNPCS